MFDAESDRKGLGFEQEVLAMHQLIDVARRVAGGQYQRIAGVFIAVRSHDRTHLAAFDEQVDHLVLEEHLAAGVEDGLAHCLDHIG